MDLTPQQQREQSAQSQKFARANTLTALGLPHRKKGELCKLFKIADMAHELLVDYDALEDSELSGYYGQVFDTTVERMRQIKPAPAAAPTSPPAPSEG